jgi:hypothetical protein
MNPEFEVEEAEEKFDAEAGRQRDLFDLPKTDAASHVRFLVENHPL